MKPDRLRDLPVLASIALAPSLASCRSMYYGTMEKFGVHKRDILVDRVEEGRDAQEEAKQEFLTTMELFKRFSDFDGGELEDFYDELKSQLDRSEDRAGRVRGRIESIEEVSSDLFEEWQNELSEIHSSDLRVKSEQVLMDTRSRYRGLIEAMRRAEASMDPVLVAFRDHVLFLKHNLNAQAIASLQGTFLTIESDIADLIAEMEASIRAANEFIETMEGSPAEG